MTIQDFAVFKLPKEREFQFPAITAMQFWVRAYQHTTSINDYPYIYEKNPNQYQLAYALDTDIDTYKWWISRGIAIQFSKDEKVYVPYWIGDIPKQLKPTIAFDFTEQRMNGFIKGPRHACQMYASITGVACADKGRDGKPRNIQTPHIVVPHDAVNLEAPYKWVAFDGILIPANMHTPASEDIMEKILHMNITGLAAYASWYTYYAATMGYAVIEVLRDGRSRSLMSKWNNPLYRCIEERHLNYDTLMSAKNSIEATCRFILEAQRQPSLATE